jgi:ferric-dicitrate binding protein FerR (iron transport regulator)
MRLLALPALLLVALAAQGQTLYVTDRVQAVVYAQPSLEGNQVRILESGDAVELVSREGDNVHIRLDDGSEGWIAGSYLVVDIPATRQLQALTAENERLRASARTDPAASGELKALKDRNAQLQADLAAAQRDLDAVQAKTAAPAAARPDDEIPVETLRPANRSRLFSILALVTGAAAALAIGFWWGYSTLERRVRRKYGGLKVY